MHPMERLLLACAMLLAGSPALAQTWAQSSAPTRYWWSMASSADGNKLVALVGGVPYATAIYTSSDAGASWTSNSVPSVEWWSVASSADGNRLLAAAYGSGGLFTSTNSGATWVSNTVPGSAWFSVASSADGLKLVAVAGGGQALGPIYTSTNAGAAWVSNTAPSAHWEAVASSADGTRLTAMAGSGYYTSTNSGLTWASNGLTSVTWGAIACSADGTKLVAAVVISGTHRMLTSSDSGATWLTNTAPIARVASVASSADGVQLVAVEADRVWFSTNSGATWASNNVAGFWHTVASSADGAKWAVGDASPGGIWLSQTTPAPKLNLLPSGARLTASWIVPSANFTLQQNLALSTTNWTDVTNAPTLNLSTLQYEVELSPSLGSAFYRLSGPGP
jgi:hypothetical protein